jgi:hypothetical protein
MNHIGPEQYPNDVVSPVINQEDIDALLASSADPSHLVATMQNQNVAAEWLMVNVISGLSDGEVLSIDEADDALDKAGDVYEVLVSHGLQPKDISSKINPAT